MFAGTNYVYYINAQDSERRNFETEEYKVIVQADSNFYVVNVPMIKDLIFRKISLDETGKTNLSLHENITGEESGIIIKSLRDQSKFYAFMEGSSQSSSDRLTRTVRQKSPIPA